jgi:hypothetical protein
MVTKKTEVKVEKPVVEINPPKTALEERVEKLEKVVKLLVSSYNGQIISGRIGCTPFSPGMEEIENI